MNLKRKDFIKLGALAFTPIAISGFGAFSSKDKSKEAKRKLSSITADAKPISIAERESRIDKAQQLH